MGNKLSLSYKVRNFLGWSLAAGSIVLFIIYRRQSLPYDIGIALGFAAYALRPTGSYLFLPIFLLLLAALLGLSNHSLITPGLALVLAIILGVYGWGENKTVSNKGCD